MLRGDTMQFSIRPKGPFHFDLTLQRYRLFGQDVAHVYADGTYYHAMEIGRKLWVYALRAEGPPAAPVLHVKLFGGRAQALHRAAVEKDVCSCLSLDVDLHPFYRWAERDPILAELTRHCYGLHPLRAPSLFETLITSITAQQVNLSFATRTRARLICRYGKSITLNGRTFYTFPTPEALSGTPLQELRDMQFSWRKAEYIVNLARLVREGELNLDEFPHLTNAEVIDRLTRIKGLGRWTADWLLARGLGRGDAIAAGDLGVRKAVGRFYFGGETPAVEEVREFVARWGMFQNLAVHYLLAGLRSPDLPSSLGEPHPALRRRKKS